jgi:hypothetical protein
VQLVGDCGRTVVTEQRAERPLNVGFELLRCTNDKAAIEAACLIWLTGAIVKGFPTPVLNLRQ